MRRAGEGLHDGFYGAEGLLLVCGRSADQGRALSGGGVARKVDLERGAASSNALGGTKSNGAIVAGDERFGYPEAEARPLEFLGGEEGVEDLFLDVAGDAGTLVVNGDTRAEFSAAGHCSQPHYDAGVVWCGFHGVADEVSEHLSQLTGETADGG